MKSGSDSPAATTGQRPLRALLHLAGPYWNSERRTKARGATLLLLLLTVAQVGLTVWGNYWNRALFDALEQRTARGVLVQVAVFALIFAISIAVTAAHLMVKRWLQLDWRAWLTGQLVDRWMAEGRHYRLQFSRGDHDNPDQRIAEDIRIATESAIGLAHTLVFSLLVLVMFTDILWSVSGSIALPGTEVQVPGYLVPLAFVYAIAGSLFGWMFGRPLVRTTNALQTAEASFRFGLSRVRDHAEVIALTHGEPYEREGSATKFSQVARDWDRQSLAYLGLVSFGTAYGALLPVFPILIAAPQYIAGAMTLGVLMQAAQAFQGLASALSWPVNNIGEIARCRASADRVLSLHAGILRLDADSNATDTRRIRIDRSGRGHLVIDDLCIAEPTGQVLVEHLNASIRRGERVLVRGDATVTGRLFKVLGGLWPWGEGRVSLPGDEPMAFVPQRPFLPHGTLREAICYPQRPEAFPDAALHYALECAGLAWLSPRLEERDDWEQSLPLRAQQRIGIARIVLQRPAWVLMEGATDAFDPKSEQRVLETLHRELPGATLITISFHDGLESLHHRELVLARQSEPKTLGG